VFIAVIAALVVAYVRTRVQLTRPETELRLMRATHPESAVWGQGAPGYAPPSSPGPERT
jgi:hypothetical protein